MEAEARRGPRSTRLMALLVGCAAVAFAGFVALGVWQVHRLAWKQDLIARVERNVHGAPVPAPGPDAWPRLSRGADEYRRVRLRGEFAHKLETAVRASTALGAGYWILTPLRTERGFWVLVNRGFVPPELRERGTREMQEPEGPQEVVGLLRFSEPGGSLLQGNAPAEGRWYSRDVQAIATARGLGAAPVAPYFVDATAPDAQAATGYPRPGLTVLHFSNNHAVYAATWFALAAMVAGAIGYLVIDERRLRRLAAAAGEPDRAVHPRR
jgi:surfeit locus 1 family protein